MPTHRPKWGLYGVRITMGHGVSLKVAPGLYANGMLSYQFDDFDEYLLVSAGLTLSPGQWLKQNL
ncbi:MAG TPA: hypothetical protein VHS96_12435, partial [Bacteroidia bacterium]|nr:hypothetical protein [Bacteroidia bacterium]